MDIAKLDVKPGDTLLVRFPEDSSADMMRQMLTQVKERTGAGLVIGLRPGQSIETLDEEAMEHAGWVRRPGATCWCGASCVAAAGIQGWRCPNDTHVWNDPSGARYD